MYLQIWCYDPERKAHPEQPSGLRLALATGVFALYNGNFGIEFFVNNVFL